MRCGFYSEKHTGNGRTVNVTGTISSRSPGQEQGQCHHEESQDRVQTMQRKCASKIKKCKTDQVKGLEWDNPDRPEAANLLNIYQSVTGLEHEAILREVSDLSWGAFKPRLTDAVVAHLEPIQRAYKEIAADQHYLSQTLKQGAYRADEIATRTLDDAKSAMGINIKTI